MARVNFAYTAVLCVLVVGCDRAAFNKHVEEEVNRIELQVAEDTEKQYVIAKRSGDAMDAYVQASLVAAAYLQAKDETNYQKWKAIEKSEARNVGLE